MIDAAATVKRDLGHTSLNSALADELAHELGGILVGAQLAGCTELGVERGSAADGLRVSVVDDLSVDVGVGAVHGEARTLGGAEDLGAHATLAALEAFPLGLELVHCFSLETRHHLTG